MIPSYLPNTRQRTGMKDMSIFPTLLHKRIRLAILWVTNFYFYFLFCTLKYDIQTTQQKNIKQSCQYHIITVLGLSFYIYIFC